MALKNVVCLITLLAVATVLLSCSEEEQLTEVSIAEMAQDYLTNAFRADKKYDKPLLVSGRVLEIQNSGTLKLMAGGYTHVEAELKGEDELLTLDRGDEADLRCDGAHGSADSLGAFIYLEGCELYDKNAKLFDDIYREQIGVGKSEAVAKSYATGYTEQVIRYGKSDEYARYFAEVGGGMAGGGRDAFAANYAQKRMQGASAETARAYADDPQYFDAYTKAIAEGKSEEDAAFYAEHEAKGRQAFLEAYTEARDEGISHGYAVIYAERIEEGALVEYARAYVQASRIVKSERRDERYVAYYALQLMEGKSHEEAASYPEYLKRLPPGVSDILVLAYAQLRDQGKTHEYAFAFADAFAKQVKGDRTQEFASNYAHSRAEGFSHEVSLAYAEQIEQEESVE